jgi:hypothetical protein
MSIAKLIVEIYFLGAATGMVFAHFARKWIIQAINWIKSVYEKLRSKFHG